MSAIDRLFDAMLAGRGWELPPAPIGPESERDGVRQLLRDVFEERNYASDWKQIQARTALRGGDEDGAQYPGVINAENPTSGPYQGTSFAWFPGDGGSLAVLVIGTGGFGADAGILGRPGHHGRLQALARLHQGRLWVKPDPLDLQATVPEAVTREWPGIQAVVREYGGVIHAAVVVREMSARAVVEDLLVPLAHEHGLRFKGSWADRWTKQRESIAAELFPRLSEVEIEQLLFERRFVILQGPPGTGKTRLALRVAGRFGEPTTVQFHPARTYEDFVIGLAPQPTALGLTFSVRAGDLRTANERARAGGHVLLIDEINRGDLARVVGEAICLFEPSEPDRTVELPHPPVAGSADRSLRLQPSLMVLGTRNTADRSIARIDLAIRRRFAFVNRRILPSRSSRPERGGCGSCSGGFRSGSAARRNGMRRSTCGAESC